MAVFKCKMCGGDLDIQPGMTVCECQYCGGKQTLPKLDGDRKNNLYDRANHFRRNNEYDKAMTIYEQILNEEPEDAESYWSIVLCQYGVEYVEDPKTRKRIPTVNRAQFTSVLADENYKSALKYADAGQRSIYESEAVEIDRIQKGILEISNKEEPFDVFICYKETDANGRRTPDSVLANDLYHQLRQEGFKVFFARITLEDKLGSAYEPYIFAALNSAKVMVVLGTKPEYFEAVWVKNEWSRFLTLIKKGEKKVLIPAYKDMDPYDLPEEFSHLQAQDMSKLGFMQDLIRGIKKLTDKMEVSDTKVKEVVVTGTSQSVEPLIKRAFLFIEDANWDNADDYLEKVLDIDPENAQAYLGKLMIDLEAKSEDELRNYKVSFEKNSNYQKALRFAENELADKLREFCLGINERNEYNQKNAIYEETLKLMEIAAKRGSDYAIEDYKQAADKFEKLGDFRNAKTLAMECREKAEVAHKEHSYNNACYLLTKGGDIKNYNLNSVEEALKLFQAISDWKDSEIKMSECYRKISEIKEWEERNRIEQERKAEEERLKKQQLEEKRKIEAERRARQAKKIAMIVTPIAIVCVIFIILLNTVIIPASNYKKAIASLSEKRYEEAISAFNELASYKDSEDKLALVDLIKQVGYGGSVDLLKEVPITGTSVEITYNENGGILQEEKNTFLYASAEELTSFEPIVWEGHTFSGWNCENIFYDADTDILKVELTASWDISTYDIQYNMNGADKSNRANNGNPSQYTITSGAIKLLNPTRTGYTFAGWTGTELHEPTLEVTIPEGSTGDRSYTACWEPNTYKVTLNTDGEKLEQTTYDIVYGTEITFPVPQKTGYTFAGWYYDKKIMDGIWEIAENVELTAKWTPMQYTVTYDLGGVKASNTNTTSFNIESSISLKEAEATGYKFLGWYSDSTYKNKVTNIAEGSTGNMTLYAKWETITYTVTYELNGGSAANTLVKEFTVKDLPLTLPELSKENYDFICWTLDSFAERAITEITECQDYQLCAYFVDEGFEMELSENKLYWIVKDYNGIQKEVSIPEYYGTREKLLPVNVVEKCGSIYITDLFIPATVNKISPNAFIQCGNLKSLTVPFMDSRRYGSTNGTIVLDYTLKHFFGRNIPSTLEKVVITGGNEIYRGAFANGSTVTSIELPASITCIKAEAFYNCSSLKEIIFNGEKLVWETMYREYLDMSYWEDIYGLPSGCTVYCSDGTIVYD